MDTHHSESQQEMVKVILQLPRDVVDWIDGIKEQMGFRSRGPIVAQMLRELIPEFESESESENAS